MLSSKALKRGYRQVRKGERDHDGLVDELRREHGGSREDAVDAIEEHADRLRKRRKRKA
jgi:hypothetical protein